jgi:hypothetical protein
MEGQRRAGGAAAAAALDRGVDEIEAGVNGLLPTPSAQSAADATSQAASHKAQSRTAAAGVNQPATGGSHRPGQPQPKLASHQVRIHRWIAVPTGLATEL